MASSIPNEEKFKGAPNLIEMLRVTLSRLEESEELSPADPALVELKNSLLRAIGEIELKKMTRSLVA